jgi:hypothetical protein
MRETHGNGCVDVSRSRKPVEIEKFHWGSEPIQTRFLHDTNTEIPNRQSNRRSEKKTSSDVRLFHRNHWNTTVRSLGWKNVKEELTRKDLRASATRNAASMVSNCSDWCDWVGWGVYGKIRADMGRLASRDGQR